MQNVRGVTIETLYSASQIADRNTELAKAIFESRYQNLLVVAVLKGSFVFAADLIRAMHKTGLSPEMEFISVSSYGGGTTAGALRLLRDIDTDPQERDILLIDDILESGRTLAFIKERLISRGAHRVEIAVLLDKPGKRRAEIRADHVGFTCPDHFVVGYGMDKGHAFRELPFVGIVKDQ